MSSRLKKRSSGAVLVGELEKAAETVSSESRVSKEQVPVLRSPLEI